jgi:hypothetical protein
MGMPAARMFIVRGMTDGPCKKPPLEIMALVVTRFVGAVFECLGEVESEVDWNERIERKRGET